MSGNEKASGKFSAQMLIVTLMSLVTWVLMDALRQAQRLELNPVNQVPTNVYCSPGGDCYHTSRKCEGLKNVPTDAVWRRLSCMYCVQRNGQ